MEPADRIVATILGCGSSGGVPRVGNVWGACDPQNPKNRRRRCALLLTGSRLGHEGKTRIVIDTGCDLREQLLDARVDRVDAVLYTHEHADHTHGIDDLRVLALNARRMVDIYCSERTEARLRQAFGYCFSSAENGAYPPILLPHTVEAGETLTVEGEGGAIVVTTFLQEHGDITSLGFRIGDFAYSCDLSGLPPAAHAAVDGLDVWVLDALRYTPHPSHLHLAQSLALIEKHRPRRAVLTNLHIDLDYERLDAETPGHVEPAHDGLEIEISGLRASR